MKKIAIIGAGSWGTSIGIVIAEANPNIKVMFWAYEKSVSASINNNHENTEYLPGRILPGNISASSNLKTAVENSDGIIFATPSKVTFDIASKVSRYISDDVYIGHLTKGFCKINAESPILNPSDLIEGAASLRSKSEEKITYSSFICFERVSLKSPL